MAFVVLELVGPIRLFDHELLGFVHGQSGWPSRMVMQLIEQEQGDLGFRSSGTTTQRDGQSNA
jgi:hypothetical protein